MNVVAFDLEIAKIITDQRDLNPAQGLGISCAAAANGRGRVVTWPSQPPYQERLTPDDAQAILNYLDNGPTVITWNGLGFDFYVLGVEAGDLELAARIAMNHHVDLMLLFACVRRHRLGLKAAALAVGSHKGAGDIESGEEAPKLWAAGQHQRALEYVAQDARATLDVFNHLVEHGGFTWISRRGYEQTFALPPDLRDPRTWTVRSILRRRWNDPEGWITDPAQPSDFTHWIPNEVYLFG